MFVRQYVVEFLIKFLRPDACPPRLRCRLPSYLPLTSFLFDTMSGSTANSTRVAPQAGVLEGANPIEWSASNPIAVFIVQVCPIPPVGCILSVPAWPAPTQTPMSVPDTIWHGSIFLAANRPLTGRHHHHSLPPLTLPTKPTWPTPGHRRGHRWHFARSFGSNANPWLSSCHFPNFVHASA
jgi:hypothetical protein